jgi:arsenite-transporting ATPase
MQDEHMGHLRTVFGGQIMAQVPEMERDVTGLPMIEKLANVMFG